MADFQDYTPTTRFTNVQGLLNNHFRFMVDALPDLTFYAQSVTLPDVAAATAKMNTPFTTIPQVGDHLDFGTLQVNYLIDSAFKNYFSLFYWLRGYGFPTSYDDIVNFTASRTKQSSLVRPTPRDIVTT